MAVLRVRVGNMTSTQLSGAIAAMPSGSVTVEKAVSTAYNHFCFSTPEFTVAVDVSQVTSFLKQNLGMAVQTCMTQPIT